MVIKRNKHLPCPLTETVIQSNHMSVIEERLHRNVTMDIMTGFRKIQLHNLNEITDSDKDYINSC